MAAFLVGVLVLTSFGQTNLEWKKLQCQGRPVFNRYFNYAEGFSVAMPKRIRGRHGQVDGPERGVSIPLSPDCTGVVVVYGEPNSADLPKPTAAISSEVETVVKEDPGAEVRRYTTRVGNLKAAGVTVRHSRTSEVEDIVIAFRPGGGPVYTARLSTTKRRSKQDRNVLLKVLRSFRLEPWR